jgi:hypothetical protein
MADRRYNDEEVAAIFLKAAEDPQTPPLQPSGDDGLTLADLQQIGSEVGLSPEAVAQAARSMDVRPRAVSRTFLGLPIGVERSIALNRWLTDREWEDLVVQLREVFNARGTMSSTGSFRQWTNGNLQALLEPTPTGHRLRLRTLKASARASIAAGLGTLGATGAVSLASAVGGQLGIAEPGIVMLLIFGIGMVANGALRLPSWARLRGRQMDAITTGLAVPQGPPSTDPPSLPPD